VRLLDSSHPDQRYRVGVRVRLARFWLYRGSEAAPYNVFDFHESRSRDGPCKFFGGFQGWSKSMRMAWMTVCPWAARGCDSRGFL